MSLLSNLLAFSSLNTTSQRQQRSASAGGRFLFEADQAEIVTEPKHRVVSKSLSKMGLLSSVSQSKIDPKYRCLHRMTHNLSMKVRKHYYALFVTLQTLKKKNIYLNKKPQRCPQKLQAAVAKLSYAFSIIYLKQYESSYKDECFSKIKSYSKDMHFPKTLQRVCLSNQYKFYGRRLFKYFNQLQKLGMKFDLIQTSLEPIVKKSNKCVLEDCFNVLKKYERATNFESPKKQQNQPRSVSIFQVFDKIQKKVKESTEKKSSNLSLQIIENLQQMAPLKKSNEITNATQEKLFKPNFDSDSDYSKQKARQSQSRQRFSLSKTNYDQRNQFVEPPSLNRFRSLQASPTNRGCSKAKSPYKIGKKILNIKQSVSHDTLESRSYQKVYKSYQICLDFEQKPYQLQFHYQSVPKMLRKLVPQQLQTQLVQDLADKSNIFRDFKNSKVSAIQSLQISNVIGEPFMRAETLISDIQRNREGERSQISYSPFLPHDNSMQSMNIKQESNFGCDAVSFKNSLVMQRQSMKKTQREKIDMFVKKKTFVGGGDFDHQSQQLQNLKNRRKSKNQFSDRKICQNLYPQRTFQQSYAYDSDYLIKRDSLVYETGKQRPNLNLQSTGTAWDEKKSHHEYSSEGKSKIYSLNSSSTDLIPRRLRFNVAEYDKKNGDDTFVSHITTNSNSASSTFRDPLAWKNEVMQNRSVMPVRDVGLDPFSKLRSKNNMNTQSQLQVSKDSYMPSKKFINISKR